MNTPAPNTAVIEENATPVSSEGTVQNPTLESARDAAVSALERHISPKTGNYYSESKYKTLLQVAAESHADVVASGAEAGKIVFENIKALLQKKEEVDPLRLDESAIGIIAETCEVLASRYRELVRKVTTPHSQKPAQGSAQKE